jgi:predicted membrane metal-binding protein
MVVEAEVGAVWVTVDGAPAVWPGDRVRVRGRLRSPRGYRNPGSPDRAQVARGRGVRWELRAREIAVVAAADRWSAWRWSAQTARAAAVAIAARGGDPVGNALVRAVVVGDRSGVPPATDDAWRAAGVYHALSVSGLHLAVVARGVRGADPAVRDDRAAGGAAAPRRRRGARCRSRSVHAGHRRAGGDGARWWWWA